MTHDAVSSETLADLSDLQAEEPVAEALGTANEPQEARLVEDDLRARIAAIPTEPHTKIVAEKGRIVIEELDTPAIRREKALRKKAEKAAAAAFVVTSASPSYVMANTESPGADDSDLTSLSGSECERGTSPLERQEESNDAQSNQIIPVQPLAPPVAMPAPRKPGTMLSDQSKTLEGGTLGKS